MKIKKSITSPKHDNNEFSSFTSNGEGVIEIKLEVTPAHFDTSELAEELVTRSNIDLYETELLQALEVSTDLNDKFEEFNSSINKMSMKDHLKFEHLMQIFSKYSLEEIEFKLPN